MPRAPKTPRNRRIPTPTPPRTKSRPPYDFTERENIQILLAYFSLVPQHPSVNEVHQVLATDAYTVQTLGKQIGKLKDRASAVRQDRKDRQAIERAASDHGDESDYEGSEISNDPPTPPETSDMSMSPDTPVVPRRQRESSPTARRHETRAADGRGRARDNDNRRAASAHPAARRQRETNERSRGGREETLPPRQLLRGRRDGGRSSRGRNRSSSPAPYQRFAVDVQVPAHRR